MEAPLITVFVRHSSDCKYAGDEFCKRCNCRKHLRWSRNGKQYRRKSGSRTWAGAEDAKRQLEEELTGRKPITETPRAGMLIEDAVEAFMRAKRNDGLEAPSLQKLQKTCDRIWEFSKASGVFLLEDINLMHLTTWDWGLYFNTTHSIRTNQERVKTFFRYFHNAGVIARNPAVAWQRIKGKTPQVSGFTPAEFDRVLAAIPDVERKQAYRDRDRTQKAAKDIQQKLRAFVLVMRYAGLAIIDAACLERSQIFHQGDSYRIQLRSRQKTSKRETLQRIDNAIPPSVGQELMAVANGNARYVFWDRDESRHGAEDAEKRDAVKYWHKWIRALLDAAGLPDATSHKFRHTLAIEIIRHGGAFEDVAAALGNTVGVVAKFYSHEWAKVRQTRTDAALKAAWVKIPATTPV
jgi:site-specific recombinase XerD